MKRRRCTICRELGHKRTTCPKAGGVPASKTCAWCGSKFVRGPTEGATNYRRRKTCSLSCASSLAGKSRTKPPLSPRTCSRCGSPFEQKPGQSRRDFERQSTCGRPECISAVIGPPRRVVPERKCESCGAVLKRRSSEKATGFAQRRFCDHRCASRARIRTVVVHGVAVPRSELARSIGVSVDTIRLRVREGRDVLTGRRQPANMAPNDHSSVVGPGSDYRSKPRG